MSRKLMDLGCNFTILVHKSRKAADNRKISTSIAVVKRFSGGQMQERLKNANLFVNSIGKCDKTTPNFVSLPAKPAY